MRLSIRAARVNAGLTQQEVFAKTGIARSTLTRWEYGLTVPNEKNKARLCSLYGLDADEIDWEKGGAKRWNTSPDVR